MSRQTPIFTLTLAATGVMGAVFLAGCGSGGGGLAGLASTGNPSSNAQGQSQVVGPLAVKTADITSQPVTAAGKGAVVTGLAGGTVSGLVLTSDASGNNGPGDNGNGGNPGGNPGGNNGGNNGGN